MDTMLQTYDYRLEPGETIQQAFVNAAKVGDLPALKHWQAQGADILAESDYAVRYAAENGHLEVVRYLKEQGADIRAADDDAVRSAAEKGHLEVVRYLV